VIIALEASSRDESIRSVELDYLPRAPFLFGLERGGKGVLPERDLLRLEDKFPTLRAVC